MGSLFASDFSWSDYLDEIQKVDFLAALAYLHFCIVAEQLELGLRPSIPRHHRHITARPCVILQSTRNLQDGVWITTGKREHITRRLVVLEIPDSRKATSV